ncbi:MAG: prolyl oligopeptidase family serine peptidase [Planctomycetota bacterium]|nr:prolyl oligopeptidase family serine peptidase [Planctomycetota bacterium]
MWRWSAALCLTGLLMADAEAGEAPMTAADKTIRRYLAARAAELERDFLPGVKTAADFEKARPELRQAYLYMLGLWPLPEKTPLNAKVTGKLEQPGYTVEKVHFQSRPGLYVTADLYLPQPAQGRCPAILYQCGHSYEKRDGNKTAYQDHGIWFATHGYVALVTDSLQLGEIAAIHHGTYREGRWWWHSAGYTPAGVECWNAIRAIDYLSSRPEVDPDRIGASGISGGGSATMWISAADERVKAAAPVSGMADLGYYVGEDGVNGHCDCMFLYNQARWNWTAIPALICPRPLLFVNSDADTIFPMSANERIIARLERLYARFGASDKVDAMVSVGGHAYRTDLRRAIFEFFNRHLKQDARPVEDADAGLAPGSTAAKAQHHIEHKLLRVFAEDGDLPTDQLNTRIDQLFVPVAKLELPAADGFERWRKDLLERLRVATFNAWPPAAPDVKAAALGEKPEEGQEATEEGLEVSWRWLPGKEKAGAPWLIVLNAGEPAGELPEWARAVVVGGSALLLAPRGTGAGAWTRKNPPNTVERSMALLGGTVDGGRVWDIVSVVRRRAEGGKTWRAAGFGQAGVLAAYAALYEPAIEAVVAVNPPPSHRPAAQGGDYGPALLNVLRVLDIPDAFGCLAPRRLTLIGAKDAAFERTTALYKLAGAADRLEQR